ncbi:phenylacetic acid degradation protein PaaN, partial [Streptomyces carpinensis]
MHHAATEAPDLFARHRTLLEQAVAATESRKHWTPYPESPSKSVYGEDAAYLGEAAFREQIGRPFDLPGHPAEGRVAPEEHSPYGFPLGISYPRLSPASAVAAAKDATAAWRKAGPDTRAGVAAEILARLNAASFEIAHAVQHTTGQAFVMAFQAGGPHAQDRGLEAVANAWAAQKKN